MTINEQCKPLYCGMEAHDQLLSARVFYDVGANEGDWIQRYLDRGAVVHAFEPVPNMADKLNARFGNNPRVWISRFAVAENSRQVCGVKVCYAWALLQGAEEHQVALDYKGQSFDMQTIGLDEYIANGNPTPDLIKIDVDGYEYNVLNGARELLLTKRPLIVFEFSDLLRHLGQSVEPMCNFIYDLGYVAMSIDCKYTCPDAVTMARLCPRGSSYDVFLIPKEHVIQP